MILCQSIGCECLSCCSSSLKVIFCHYVIDNTVSWILNRVEVIVWVFWCECERVTCRWWHVIMMPACRSRDNCWNCSTIPQPHNVCLQSYAEAECSASGKVSWQSKNSQHLNWYLHFRWLWFILLLLQFQQHKALMAVGAVSPRRRRDERHLLQVTHWRGDKHLMKPHI